MRVSRLWASSAPSRAILKTSLTARLAGLDAGCEAVFANDTLATAACELVADVAVKALPTSEGCGGARVGPHRGVRDIHPCVHNAVL